MSTEDNKSVARRSYDVINKAFSSGNFENLGEVVSDNFVDHNPQPGQGPGIEGTKQSFMVLRNAFPDAHFTAEDMVAEGDKVVSRVVIRGTNTGSFLGHPPTGKRVALEVIEILRIADGKTVERWAVTDNMGMMRQLGLIPPPGGRE